MSIKWSNKYTEVKYDTNGGQIMIASCVKRVTEDLLGIRKGILAHKRTSRSFFFDQLVK